MVKIADLIVLSNEVKKSNLGVQIPSRHVVAHDRQDKDSAVNALHPKVIGLFKKLVSKGGCLHNTV